jgi:hypothetical protein
MELAPFKLIEAILYGLNGVTVNGR